MTTVCISYDALDIQLSEYLGHMTDVPSETKDSLRLTWDKELLMIFMKPYLIVNLVCSVKGKIGSVNQNMIEKIEQ